MAASSIWQAIGYKLLNTATVTAIAGARIYHGDKPPSQTGFPAINYFRVSDPLMHKGLVRGPRYQVSCRAETAGAAEDLADAVAVAMGNLQESIDGFDVFWASVIDRQLITEHDPDVYHVPVDVRLTFKDQ